MTTLKTDTYTKLSPSLIVTTKQNSIIDKQKIIRNYNMSLKKTTLLQTKQNKKHKKGERERDL